MTLMIQKGNEHRVLLRELEIADTFWSRGIGLLRHNTLTSQQALWIKPGIIPVNSIHTFFMQFEIDCVFLNKKQQVVKLISKVGPWKIMPPQRRAYSVIEMAGGQIQNLRISEGDSLYVGG